MRSVAFSPNNKTIGTGSNDKTVVLYNYITKKIEFTINKHKSYVLCIAFSKDGKRVGTASADNKALVFNIEKQKLEFELSHHT